MNEASHLPAALSPKRARSRSTPAWGRRRAKSGNHDVKEHDAGKRRHAKRIPAREASRGAVCDVGVKLLRVIFPLAFLAEGRVPAAGYSVLVLCPCSGIPIPRPDFTHANANRQSLGRFDGRAAVSVERYERIEVIGSSRGPTVCHRPHWLSTLAA